jgi:hypothetical protein
MGVFFGKKRQGEKETCPPTEDRQKSSDRAEAELQHKLTRRSDLEARSVDTSVSFLWLAVLERGRC